MLAFEDDTRSREDQSLDTAVEHQPEVAGAFAVVGSLFDAADDQVVVAPPRLELGAGDGAREESVRDVGGHHPEGVRPVRDQAARHRARHISQLLDRVEDPPARVVGDARLAVDDTRDRLVGDCRQRRDVPDRGAPSAHRIQHFPHATVTGHNSP
jgi:hypothetical protein